MTPSPSRPRPRTSIRYETAWAAQYAREQRDPAHARDPTPRIRGAPMHMYDTHTQQTEESQ